MPSQTQIPTAGERHHQEAPGGSEGSGGEDQGEEHRDCVSRKDPAGNYRETPAGAARTAGHPTTAPTERGRGTVSTPHDAANTC